MDQLALGMQVIQSTEKMLEAALEQDVGKAPRGISPEQVLPAVPHRFLDETLMLAARPFNGERIKSSSHIMVSRMGGVCFPQDFVGAEFIFAGLFMTPCKDLQSNIVAFPAVHIRQIPVATVSSQKKVKNGLKIPGQPHGRG